MINITRPTAFLGLELENWTSKSACVSSLRAVAA